MVFRAPRKMFLENGLEKTTRFYTRVSVVIVFTGSMGNIETSSFIVIRYP